MNRLPNIHPGEILLEEFLKPMELSQTALAKAVGVPPGRINEIVLKKRGIREGAIINCPYCAEFLLLLK